MITKIATPAESEEQLFDSQEEDVYLPSPERIRRLCALYQKTWTERERSKRTIVKTRRWTVPQVSVRADAAAFAEE